MFIKQNYKKHKTRMIVDYRKCYDVHMINNYAIIVETMKDIDHFYKL